MNRIIKVAWNIIVISLILLCLYIITQSKLEILYNNLVIGFFASLFGSILFLFGLWMLKPRLEIASKIAVNQWKGDKCYWIKVINKTKFFKIIDIQSRLMILSESNVEGGTNVVYKDIDLIEDRIWYIPSITSSDARKNATYSFIFRTTEDIDQIWSSDNEKLQVELMCKHSFSGFSRVFRKTYFLKRSSIVEGNYRFGNSFDIL